MTTLNLEVDGKPVQVPGGSTVMDAAHQLGIYVPHFCWHKKLSIAANLMGRTICALGDAAAMPVRAFLKHYRPEFERHVELQRCPTPEAA